MICTEIHDPELIARLGQSEGPRSPGLHVSDIYKKLMQRLQPKRFTEGEPNPLHLALGLAFETHLDRALHALYGVTRPGELVSDEGIALSPDGVNPTEISGEEIKLTFMSSTGGVVEEVEMDGQVYQIPRDKFLHWIVQMKAYAKWLGVTSYILRVLFVCGDYSRPFTPQFRSYRFTFTPGEIEDNWRMLTQIAREEGLL